MHTSRNFVILLVIAALLVAIVPVTFAQEGSVESVCLVTDVGRVNDGTFNQFAYEGMLAVSEELDLDNTFIETTAQTDYEANINRCVDEGYDVIITVGFLLADTTLASAQANPEVYFIGVDQFVADGPTNYVGIQFREDQAGFLVGTLAALVTESNTVAGVYGIDIPPVVKFRSGYEQGVGFMAGQLGKEVETLGVYIDDFVAPDRGASAANQFIGDGADVIFGAGGQTGTGGIQEAAKQGVWVIGVDQDEYFTSFGEGESPGSDHLISSAVKRVDVGVFDMVQVLVEGDMDAFPGGSNYILSVENGGITFAPKHDADLPDELYDIVGTVQTAMAEGKLSTGVDPAGGEIQMSVEEITEAMDFELDLSAVMEG